MVFRLNYFFLWKMKVVNLEFLVLFPIVPMVFLLVIMWFYWKMQPKLMTPEARLFWENKILGNLSKSIRRPQELIEGPFKNIFSD